MKTNVSFIKDKNGKILYMSAKGMKPYRPAKGFGGFLEGGLGAVPSAIGIGTAIGGPAGAAVGAGVGLLSGLLGSFGEDKQRKEAEKIRREQERIRKEEEARLLKVRDKAVLDSYPTEGYNYSGFYKNGGKLQGGGFTNLSNNSIKIQGDTHAMDSNKDGLTGVTYKGNEVERGEVIYKTRDGEDLVFSKALGFAQVVEPLLKDRAKFEDGLQSNDQIKRNTAYRNIEKIDNKVMSIFNMQQQVNGQQEGSSFKCGGKIRKKMEDGAVISANGYPRPQMKKFNSFDTFYDTYPYLILSRRNYEGVNTPVDPTLTPNLLPQIKPENFGIYNQNHPLAKRRFNNIPTTNMNLGPSTPSDKYGIEHGAFDYKNMYMSPTMLSVLKDTNINKNSELPVVSAEQLGMEPTVPYNPADYAPTSKSADGNNSKSADGNNSMTRNEIYNEVAANKRLGNVAPRLAAPQIPVKYGLPTSINPINTGNQKSGLDNSIAANNDKNTNLKNTLVDAAQFAIPLVSNLVSRRNINRIPNNIPTPIDIPSVNLNTDVDVSSQLNQVDNAKNSLDRTIDLNTSDSNTAIARKIALGNNAVSQKNQIIGNKINAETELKNRNLQNAQQISALNTNTKNRFLTDQFEHNVGKLSALDRADQALFASAQNILTNLQKDAYQSEQLAILGEQYGVDILGKTPEQIRKALQDKLATLLKR